MAIDLKNKKLFKEWDKIKDSDLFSSLESFAEFYYANGEKKCFRINTNEPWSKDNFFFGEYADLLVYYKEEQPKKRIGQKFHSLTILEVFWQEDKGKEELFAKCKCDCGNETIKKVNAIVKGNARTCGCNRGRRASTAPKKIKPISQELIDELWDFEKNDVDPQTIACDSTQKYWWKNNHGVSFELAPFVFLKPDTQTSFPEQAIFYSLKEHFNDVINKAQYITQYGEVVEIDIFIPSLNIGIEYDGAFWHKDRLYVDEDKNRSLNDDGIYVIRIREEGLPYMRSFDGKVIIRDNPSNPRSLIYCLNDLSEIIMGLFGIEIDQFTPTHYYRFKEEYEDEISYPFIEETCLPLFWDYKKNGELITDYIRMNSVIKYCFKCAKGKIFDLAPIEIYNASKKYKQTFTNCKDGECFYGCESSPQCCPFKKSRICPDWRVCDTLRKDKKQECRQSNVTKDPKSEEIGRTEDVTEQLITTNLKTDEGCNGIFPPSQEEKERKFRQTQGLCQHCGGSFKKKYIFFGDYICIKCGKEKDY